MGSCFSRKIEAEEVRRTPAKKQSFHPILDKFETFEEVQEAFRNAGLESSQLIVGVDFTKSNEWTGKHSYNGECLHAIRDQKNYYEAAFYAIAKTLEPFDDDNQIPCYGFGDTTTHEFGVFPFFRDAVPAQGLQSAMLRYRQIAPHVQLSGPTSFAPLIHQAIQHVIYSRMQYYILVILADGQVTPTSLQATQDAFMVAAYFPLSIVLIGIGDGPWEDMKAFDDQLPVRKFDNFQFVNFNKVMNQASVYKENEEKMYAHFALHALMEIPDQFKEIQRLGLTTADPSWYSNPNQILYSVPRTVDEADNAAQSFQ